jgi:predicted nucleotidyltransferase
MSSPQELPSDIDRLVDDLAQMPGVTAVVLGGSRAEGTFDDASDWDIGVYYRAPVDVAALRRWGEVHPPGAWGRVMNGGAWLVVGGREVDVVFRDADVVERWTERAERGDFDVDALLAYIAGVPTYLVAAERHTARVLRGEPPRRIEFPAPLAETGAARWRFCSRFSLEQAQARAKRGDVVGAAGQAARAVVEEAHARLCAQRRWVLNEKRMIERAGLGGAQRVFTGVPEAPDALAEWVARVGTVLEEGVE